MDATRQLIEKIVAMRNDARRRMKHWISTEGESSPEGNTYFRMMSELNFVLSNAGELGLTDGLNVWEVE